MENKAPSTDRTIPHPLQNEPQKPLLPGKRILIVEDEVIVAVDYHFQIIEMGWQPVAHRATNRSAIEFLNENDIDAAIVDYHLGDGTSEPLMACLREHGTPFIIITANTPEMREWTGAAAILDKPVQPRDLRAALRGLFAR